MQSTFKRSGAAFACVGAVAMLAAIAASPARAADAPAADDKVFTISGEIVVDAISVLQTSGRKGLKELDKAQLDIAADFEKAGWVGGSGLITLQNTSGGHANDAIGSLQGIDNNEVGGRRGRVFEAWIQQAFPGDHGSLKLGMIDVNSEFYVNDAAGLLLAPQSGIGSELAATGPGGPSTFPQTGLAARLEFKPTKDLYIMAGAYNANVGNLGDPHGVDTRFKEGAIEIVEAGWTGSGKLAIGAWQYSKKQDDQFDVVAGNPVKRTSSGAYVLAEHPLIDGGKENPSVTGFIRAGVSDGDTGPFKGSWQTGVLVTHVMPTRPDSQLSFGVDQAQLGAKYRKASAAAGTPLGTSESHIELTYSDALSEHVSIQPDLQYVFNPGGDKSQRTAVVAILRVTGSF